MATAQVDVAGLQTKIDEALAVLRVARRRGRPIETDQLLARKGVMPAATAAALIGKRVGTLYQAAARKRLKLTLVGEYWYVDREDFIAYVLTPKRPGRPPKARPEGTDAR